LKTRVEKIISLNPREILLEERATVDNKNIIEINNTEEPNRN